MKKRTVYIHTLNNEPAAFDGERVCYYGYYGPAPNVAESLRQIRREQQASKRWYRSRGLNEDGWTYGHKRYSV